MDIQGAEEGWLRCPSPQAQWRKLSPGKGASHQPFQGIVRSSKQNRIIQNVETLIGNARFWFPPMLLQWDLMSRV